MNRKRTAAIILNYNDSLNTLRLISQFKHYGVIDKILVVDNSDRDGLDAGLPDFDGEKNHSDYESKQRLR
ncbi:MAG TPA: hypothetical protein VHR42_00205 [Clostridia bacterium]|nr:hypothetical protein [Clostridia bacterium]